jgi:hypothetical protein
MNQVRTEIINLLAAGHTIEEVGAPDMLAEHFSVKKLLDLESHVLREYNSIRDDLEQITKYLAPALTAQDEVIKCLEFLSKKLLDYRKGESGSKSSKYYYDLIKVTWYKEWKESQQKHFDDAYEVLQDWQDYFFSYTGRNCYSLNNKYRKLIRMFLPPNERKKKSHWKKRNLLAKVIVERLKRENVVGFFDVDKICIGQELSPELEKHCKSTFVFVQLIQKEIFRRIEEGEVNWCFKEYKSFASQREMTFLSELADTRIVEERFYFLIAGDSLDRETPTILPGYCTEWHQRVDRVRHKVLPGSTDRVGLERVVVEVAKQIASIKDGLQTCIIEGVPE